MVVSQHRGPTNEWDRKDRYLVCETFPLTHTWFNILNLITKMNRRRRSRQFSDPFSLTLFDWLFFFFFFYFGPIYCLGPSQTRHKVCNKNCPLRFRSNLNKLELFCSLIKVVDYLFIYSPHKLARSLSWKALTCGRN